MKEALTAAARTELPMPVLTLTADRTPCTPLTPCPGEAFSRGRGPHLSYHVESETVDIVEIP